MSGDGLRVYQPLEDDIRQRQQLVEEEIRSMQTGDLACLKYMMA